MARPRFVVSALSAVAVVASALLVWSPETEIGFDGDGGTDRDAPVVPDSAQRLDIRDVTSATPIDVRDDRAVRRAAPPSEWRAKRAASLLPVRERGDVGDYVDPDAYPVSSFGRGVADDVGEFQDPDYDLPPPSPYGGTLDIGDYLAPEEGP